MLMDAQGKLRAPTTADMPYITFSTVSPPALESTLSVANIWDFSTSFATVDAIKKRISDAIPDISGATIDVEGGSIWLLRGTPFFQDIAEEDINIRRIYINYEIRNLSKW